MTQDAQTLQLLLHLFGRSLTDFEPKALPKSVVCFLDKADRVSLQNCLVETLCRLENLPPPRRASRRGKPSGHRKRGK